ncbi:MAG: hypothetical protein F4147_12450 [Gammaproteobacteria bacterium]|nr:hypothetical protein [Gammaproteobacteria bacterium]
MNDRTRVDFADQAQMTPAQTRVVDLILTNVSRDYMNAEHIWPSLFPIVMVAQRGGKIIEFSADDFRKYDSIRAPGAGRQRILFGHDGQPYVCVQRALDGQVPIEQMEEALAVPGINYGTRATEKTMNIVSLQIEQEAATLATDTDNYSASNKMALAKATDRWDNDASEPAKLVENGKDQIRQGIGMLPNVLAIGYSVFKALKNHKGILDRLRYVEGLSEGRTPSVNLAKLASYFDVDQVIVGAAMTGEAGDFDDIWGKNAVLAYSAVGSAMQGTPSFGYTYRVRGYPVSAPTWFDRTCDSWIYPVTTEDTPVIAGNAAGYLYSAVVT